nr:probable phosphoprotein phosphatase (EC 3.1.3.16) F21B7.27 - Arabidopsis thaliana [Arabidopsis thaliana]
MPFKKFRRSLNFIICLPKLKECARGQILGYKMETKAIGFHHLSPPQNIVLWLLINLINIHLLRMNRYRPFTIPDEDWPGPRCGHTLTAVFVNNSHQLILFGGSTTAVANHNSSLPEISLDGVTNSVHSFDVLTRKWTRLNPIGDVPSPRACHAAALYGTLILIQGGIGPSGPSDGDVYMLDMTNNKWIKFLVGGETPSPRYGHVMDIAAQRWLVIFSGNNGMLQVVLEKMTLGDTYGLKMDSDNVWTPVPAVAPSPRYQHTAVFGGSKLHVIGGILNRARLIDGEAVVADMLLDDYLMDEPKPLSSEPEASSFIMRRSILVHTFLHSFVLCLILYRFFCFFKQILLSSIMISAQVKLRWIDWQRHITYQLSKMLFMIVLLKDTFHFNMELYVISTLLRPKTWTPPANRDFFLSYLEVKHLCDEVEKIFMNEPTLLQLKVPIKVFGDIHGQYGDLMRLFHEYGHPSVEGDITHIDYLFLGDYVDRGQHSLEIIMLLFALKIEYPKNIHLIRGNHESLAMNRIYGFLTECEERMGESYGFEAWLKINQVFDYLPLAALLEKKVLCVHGGIGRAVTIEEIENIERPAFPDTGSMVLKDILWSDPTMNDTVLGIVDNARGEGVVSFGPDIVKAFLERNGLEMILRAHECVIDGFERFADGRLITVFSATNYCGTAQNAGAILVIGRDMVIYPKLIHPHPPPISSSEEDYTDKAWMQELNIEMPPTPARGESSE